MFAIIVIDVNVLVNFVMINFYYYHRSYIFIFSVTVYIYIHIIFAISATLRSRINGRVLISRRLEICVKYNKRGGWNIRGGRKMVNRVPLRLD